MELVDGTGAVDELLDDGAGRGAGRGVSVPLIRHHFHYLSQTRLIH